MSLKSILTDPKGQIAAVIAVPFTIVLVLVILFELLA